MGGLWSLFGYPKYRCRIIIGAQKGTIILTTTHMWFRSTSTGNRGALTGGACFTIPGPQKYVEHFCLPLGF